MYYPYLNKWVSDHGFTDEQFALLCGLDRTTVCKLMNGKCGDTMSKKTIDKILKATRMRYEVAFAEKVKVKNVGKEKPATE